MSLSQNKITNNLYQFIKKHRDASTDEQRHSQTFWNDFFDVFGVKRELVAIFEYPIKDEHNNTKRIDLFWEGKILVEQKSANQDLPKALEQAEKYYELLENNNKNLGVNAIPLPKYIIACNFQTFIIKNIQTSEQEEINIDDLTNHISSFNFMQCQESIKFKELKELNVKAGELIGKLYDELKSNNNDDNVLKVFLVRILFCLFADTSIIFNRGQFSRFVEKNTRTNGDDTGTQLAYLFQILDTEYNKRPQNLTDDFNFKYINGGLFKERVDLPSFTEKARDILLECCSFDWCQISPVIFGSIFQSITDQERRAELGEHYTSDENILKVIEPLFLNELREEFKSIRTTRGYTQFQDKLSKIKVLDPACGCGNFLVVAYRELRRLELEVLKKLNTGTQRELDVSILSKVDIDNFYGIEIESFPSKIAEVAMWLIDHQMNLELSSCFGGYYARIPLQKSAKIVNENALNLDWDTVIESKNLSYIIGNPPFIGKQLRNEEQREDRVRIFSNVNGVGNLDYVCCWYKKSAQYIKGTKIKCAFVSTSSISKGEQVGVLWEELYKDDIKIHFAHRTFKWGNEARNQAQVHCVIIGFANFDTNRKYIFDHSNNTTIKAKNINPYLIDCDNTLIKSRRTQISNAPEIKFGNMPNDGGHLILTTEEKDELIKNEPNAKKYIKQFMGGNELINNIQRWCLWLVGIEQHELRQLKLVYQRVEKVQKHRLKSTRETTRNLANTSHLFGEYQRQPNNNYLIIPLNTSSNRTYLPISINSKQIIISNLASFIENFDLYHFGILNSKMHMNWLKTIGGRKGNGYRYSNNIVYNNFPFPTKPSKQSIDLIEQKAQEILDIRDTYPKSSLADLYDDTVMPKDLRKAHNELDKAVDNCYGFAGTTDLERITFLFKLYEKYLNSD